MLGTGNAIGQTVLYGGRRTAPRPFDGFTALYTALGYKRLLSSHTGDILVARRSSDDDLEGFGFRADGTLDTDALLAWAGAASAYVSTWYDQSGNGRHALNATAAAQPRLVNAGVLDVDAAGNPAAVFDGSNDCLRLQNALGFSQAADQITMAARASVTNGAIGPWLFCDVWSGTDVRSGISLPTPTSARAGGRRVAGGAAAYAVGASSTGWHAHIGRIDYAGATADITVDGVTASAAFLAPGATSADTASAAPPTIGGANTVLFMAGQVSTLVLAREALDPAGLTTALLG